MEKSLLKQNFDQFISELGLKTNAFEVNCGLSKGIIANCKESVTTTILTKIMRTYPELDVYWLLGVERNAKGQQVIMPFNEEKNSCSQRNYEDSERWYREQLMQKDRQINFLMQMLEKNGQQTNF